MKEINIIMDKILNIRTDISKFSAILNNPNKNTDLTEIDLKKLNNYKSEMPFLKTEFLSEASANNIDEVSIKMFLHTLRNIETELYEIIELNNLYV